MPIIKDSSRKENYAHWLDLRAMGITATEVAALATGRKRIAQLYDEKRSAATFRGNAYTEWGNMREPVVLDYLRQETELEIFSNDDIWEAPTNNKFLATPDGVGDGFVAEVKTTGTDWEWLNNHDKPSTRKDFADAGIPHYYMQMQWQMLVCEVDRALFAWEVRGVQADAEISHSNGAPILTKIGVLDPSIKDVFEPAGYGYTEVVADADAQQELVDIATEFLAYEPAEPPQLPTRVWELRRQQDALQKQLDAVKKELTEIVRTNLVPGEKFSYPEGSVSLYVRQSSGRLDKSRLKKEHPRAYKKYVEGYTTPGKSSVVSSVRLAKKETK